MSMNTGVKINADKRYTGINAQKMLLSGITYESSISRMTQNPIKSNSPNISEIKPFPDIKENFCSGFPEDNA